MKRVLTTMIIALYTMTAAAQGYVDQKAIYPLSASQKTPVSELRKATWHRYTFTTQAALQQHIDSLPGVHKDVRRYIIELANRTTFNNLQKGKVLLVPDVFEEDYKVYSPYPFEYTPATGMPKLFIIDKYTQTFGAYEDGKLVRWGLVSTGRKDNLTPAGRYNFNWKSEYRKSTAAPPGEVWEMYWVYDFHSKFGIHVHQYSLPIARPASHGCVRTAEADAIWNFNWANGWVHDKKGRLVRNGTPVMVINHNPKGRPAQWKIDVNEIVSQVQLPVSFDKIRLGTAEQRIAPWQSGW